MAATVKYLFALAAILLLGLVYYLKYRYKVPLVLKKIEIQPKGLPKEFDELKIGHLTDLHCGNYPKGSNILETAIDMLMAEKPDIIFITGDVIERYVQEMRDQYPLLQKIKAPKGVFSILGNHEYGPVKKYKGRNTIIDHVAEIEEVQRSLGWKLLLNQNHILTIKKKKLAIIGVENHGTGRFPCEADLKKASKGTEKADFRLLLSHDPSHWENQVVNTTPSIAITFSGHTHGISYLVSNEQRKIYHYTKYYGLYRHKHQYLYVCSGIGNDKDYGRFLKPREIAIITLKH
ncbi:MAG: metallophosphoesterase [Bacteroidota bacterium]